MKKLILTNEQLMNIYSEDSFRFKLIDNGEWQQDGKSQYCRFIFKDITTDLLYSAWIGRSGSPFTEWIYDSDHMPDELNNLSPVELKEIVVKEWVVIKNVKEEERVEDVIGEYND